MEVMIPSQSLDSDFNSGRSPPRSSATKRFGECYFSAPTSPSHLSQFYKDFDEFFAAGDESGGRLASAVPFGWEEKPGTPKSPARINNGDDFAFNVSQDWETASLSAEELFDGGLIKPLKPPPRLQLPQAARVTENITTSPRKKPAVISSQTRKMIQGAFSPRHKNKETDPFAVAARNAAKAAAGSSRGRERTVNLPKSSSRRAARSLSPLRDVTQYPWEEEEAKEQPHNADDSSPPSTVCSALSASGKGHKKWRLKDFFLFRSASEGRAADKDPLKKYTAAFRHSSFRAIESPGSGSGSRRRGPVSAHELHYTMNRAVSEDLKKKTFLPYKQGILGRLAFNPAVHALANGFGFSRK